MKQRIEAFQSLIQGKSAEKAGLIRQTISQQRGFRVICEARAFFNKHCQPEFTLSRRTTLPSTGPSFADPGHYVEFCAKAPTGIRLGRCDRFLELLGSGPAASVTLTYGVLRRFRSCRQRGRLAAARNWLPEAPTMLMSSLEFVADEYPRLCPINSLSFWTFLLASIKQSRIPNQGHR